MGLSTFQIPVKWFSVLYLCLNVCFVLLSLNFLIKPTEHLLVTSCQGNYLMYFVFVRCVLYLMTGISVAFKCLYFDLSNSRTLGV